MFIDLSAPPSAPLNDLVLMPKLSQTEDWFAVEDLDYWDADPATIPQHLKKLKIENN